MEKPKCVEGKQTNERTVFKCHFCVDLNHYCNMYRSFLSSVIYSKYQSRYINTDVVVYCIRFHIFKLFLNSLKYYIILECLLDYPSLQLTSLTELTGLPVLELAVICVSSRPDAQSLLLFNEKTTSDLQT